MKLKMLGLLGALVFAVPVAAVAAPASGLTAQTSTPIAVTPALDTNAAVDPAGPTAKVEKVWWRGGYGWRGRGFGWRGRGFGWRGGYGFRRFGYGYGFRRPFFGGYYGYGFRRPFFRRRWWY